MPSTVIRRFEYHPETRELEILFTTGRRYLYSDVPEEVVVRFRQAYSKGSYFNRFIRDRYRCRELTESHDGPPGADRRKWLESIHEIVTGR